MKNQMFTVYIAYFNQETNNGIDRIEFDSMDALENTCKELGISPYRIIDMERNFPSMMG